MILQIILLLGAVGPEAALQDRVDVQELNHFYNEEGKLVFHQIIYYEWQPYSVLRESGVREEGWRYQVVDWRLVRGPDIIPQYDHARKAWVALFQDGDDMRRVESTGFRETWTQYDPELVEREWLDKERRRKLRKWIDRSKTQLETPFAQVP